MQGNFDSTAWSTAHRAPTSKPIQGAPAVNSCGNIEAPIDGPKKFVPSDCSEATYTVNSVQELPDDCIADSDNRFYRNNGESSYTACLDYNWGSGKCIAMTASAATSMPDCRVPSGHRTFKASLLRTGVPDASICPEVGFSYKVRKLAVCTTELR
ncbi:hypothetical protein GCM10009581_00090 [Tsukamurella strandjordii]